MNSFECKELKRIKESRDKWKQKAIDRHKQIRKLKCKVRDITVSRDMWKERWLSLKRNMTKPHYPRPSKVVFVEISHPKRRITNENAHKPEEL